MKSRRAAYLVPALVLPALAVLAVLAGCGGGSSGVSPATNFANCLSLNGTIYTADGPVGADNGQYPCSDPYWRSRAATARPTDAAAR